MATLLYAHMLCEQLRSELNSLTGCFKRIHCITFGTPPISLLPLQKPAEPRLKKSLFLSFINEGDPVPRADKAYIRSLLDLYASPAPALSPTQQPTTATHIKPFDKPLIPIHRPLFFNKRRGSAPAILPTPAQQVPHNQQRQQPKQNPPRNHKTSHSITSTIWPVPPGILSNAGRLVILRHRRNLNGNTTAAAATNATDGNNGDNDDDIAAQIATDENLRGMVFGDPLRHMMSLYARRVQVLATKAVTAAQMGQSVD